MKVQVNLKWQFMGTPLYARSNNCEGYYAECDSHNLRVYKTDGTLMCNHRMFGALKDSMEWAKLRIEAMIEGYYP